jgi:hypothetical protein
LDEQEEHQRKQPHPGENEQPVPIDSRLEPPEEGKQWPLRPGGRHRCGGRRAFIQSIALLQPSTDQLRERRFDGAFTDSSCLVFH